MLLSPRPLSISEGRWTPAANGPARCASYPALGAVRFSLSRTARVADVDRLCEVLPEVLGKLQPVRSTM